MPGVYIWAKAIPPLFTYCTQALHLSEHAAYGRIEGARAARRFPIVMEFLADGSLNVTTIGLLAPHLTDDNHQTLLLSARYTSKRDVERMVAALRPLPAVPSNVRKLPAPMRRPAHSARQSVTTEAMFLRVTTWNCVVIANQPRSSRHPRRCADRPSSPRSHRHGIASRSQFPRKHMTTCGVPRICCDTRSQVAIRR